MSGLDALLESLLGDTPTTNPTEESRGIAAGNNNGFGIELGGFGAAATGTGFQNHKQGAARFADHLLQRLKQWYRAQNKRTLAAIAFVVVVMLSLLVDSSSGKGEAVTVTGDSVTTTSTAAAPIPMPAPTYARPLPMPTLIVTPQPTPVPTKKPHLEAAHKTDFLPDHTVLAISEGWFTPQAKAFKWMEQHSEFETMPDWRRLQLMALATFFYSTGGTAAWPEKWKWLNASTDECGWHGIDCDKDKRITLLELHALASPSLMKGTIPPELSFLTSTTALLVHHFLFESSSRAFPTEMGLLTKLKELNLVYSRLSGSIPTELALLSNSLELLYLGKTGLRGRIPTVLGALTVLQELGLQDNGLTGSIPYEFLIDKMSNLGALWLQNNTLTGSLWSPPSSSSSKMMMEYLDLSGNALTGSLPTEMLEELSSSLYSFSLHNNILTGPLPTELGLLTKLNENLLLNNNQFTGTMPTQLGQLSLLWALDLHENQLSGTIPTELKELTNLRELKVSTNWLTGSVPSSICEIGLLSKVEVDCDRMYDTVTCNCSQCSEVCHHR